MPLYTDGLGQLWQMFGVGIYQLLQFNSTVGVWSLSAAGSLSHCPNTSCSLQTEVCWELFLHPHSWVPTKLTCLLTHKGTSVQQQQNNSTKSLLHFISTEVIHIHFSKKKQHSKSCSDSDETCSALRHTAQHAGLAKLLVSSSVFWKGQVKKKE